MFTFQRTLSLSLIVVTGRLRCLGSAQHLKHRFGNGLEVNIKTQQILESDMLHNFTEMVSRVPSILRANRLSDDIEAATH